MRLGKKRSQFSPETKASPKPAPVLRIKARDGAPFRVLDADQLVLETARSVAGYRHYVRELWQRRSLIRVLAGRELKSSYEMNVVGFAWWLMEPLSLTAVYYFLINVLRGGTSTPRAQVLQVLVAVLPYKWLASSLIGSMGVVRANSNLVTDLYFPRALLPITEIAVGLAHFLVGLLVIPLFMIALGIAPSWSILALPLVVFVQSVLILGLAYPMSVWGLNYRNLPGLTVNLLRLWFYLSPGLYTLDSLHVEWARRLMHLNPLTGLFESYRGAVVTGSIPVWDLLYSFVFGGIFVVAGGFYFTRREPHFGKML
ncbi:MAG: hypothetical protein WDA27_09305 [Actinomycetota bacterium]